MTKKTAAFAAIAGLTFSFGIPVASAAHRHVDTPSGCHAVAYQAGPNSDGRSQWNNNAGAQGDESSPTQSSGECPEG